MTLGANGYQPIVTSPLMVRSAEGASRTINKYSPDQPRVPAGNGRASGEWTSEGSDWGSPDFAIHGADRTPAPSKPAAPHAGTSSNAAPAHSLLDDGVYRPRADGAPKLTLVQEDEPEESEPDARTPEEIMALALSREKVQDIIARVEAIDPDWSPPDQLTGLDPDGQPNVADQLANDAETIAAAQARLEELRNQSADFAGEPIFDPSNLEDKLKNYALDPKNDENGGKADWFKQVLGFDQSNWRQLADQIYFDEEIATPVGNQPEGQLYRQYMSIRGANGATAEVKFGFIKTWSGVVRLTSAMAGRW